MFGSDWSGVGGLLGLFGLGKIAKDGIVNSIDDEQSRSQALNTGERFYYDSKGRMRWSANDRWIVVDVDQYGCSCYKDVKNGKVYEHFEYDRKQKEKQEKERKKQFELNEGTKRNKEIAKKKGLYCYSNAYANWFKDGLYEKLLLNGFVLYDRMYGLELRVSDDKPIISSYMKRGFRDPYYHLLLSPIDYKDIKDLNDKEFNNYCDKYFCHNKEHYSTKLMNHPRNVYKIIEYYNIPVYEDHIEDILKKWGY